MKTNMIYSCLSELSGAEAVLTVDSYNWKKNFIKLTLECINLIKNCEQIIIISAENGLRVFVPFFLSLNRLYHRKIHIIAVGGWLPEYLASRGSLVKQLSAINSIHVESRSIIDKLKLLGLNNVFYMPNIKRIEPVQAADMVVGTDGTLRLCTFSRVMREKGIELAVKSVYEANKIIGEKAYEIDIYGMIDNGYEAELGNLMEEYDCCAVYKGIVSSDESVDTLKKYTMLLFLTYYEGEGFAGTLLDSMASGLPVLASDWKYNPEIILDGCNGFLCRVNDMASVVDKLVYIYNNKYILNDMKLNCIEQYKNYDYRNVIPEFMRAIEGEYTIKI